MKGTMINQKKYAYKKDKNYLICIAKRRVHHNKITWIL